MISGIAKIQRKTGAEKFRQADEKMTRMIGDFWSWAYSDLLENTVRGKLAEYIVAMALGIADGTSSCWEKYDLEFEGHGIEVKTSAYLQAWKQERLSKIIFNVPPTYGWDEYTGSYDAEQKRQAEIYIFCVLKHLDEETIEPMDLDQWDFYVVRTKELNQVAGAQKTISLARLKGLGYLACSYVEIRQKTLNALGEE